MGRNSKSTDVKQLIDENSNTDTISGNEKFAEKFNKYSTNIGNTYGDKFSDSSAFEDYMSSAIVGKTFKYSIVILESFETIVSSREVK